MSEHLPITTFYSVTILKLKYLTMFGGTNYLFEE